MSDNQKERVRIQLKSFDHKLLDISFQKIQKIAEETDCKLVGPIPLPTKRRRYCVLTSPHVNKKARDHFEIRTHKRIIDIYQPLESTFENLKKLDFSAGVDVEVINFY